MSRILDWRELVRDFAAFIAITVFITGTALLVVAITGLTP